MALLESGEMYLESIHILSKAQPNIRSVDISEYMGYSKPSVSRAMGILKKSGYITVDENGFITLTQTGKQVAEKIFERHRVISDLLIRLGVTPSVAADDACRIEHAISDESFQAIKAHLEQYAK